MMTSRRHQPSCRHDQLTDRPTNQPRPCIDQEEGGRAHVGNLLGLQRPGVPRNGGPGGPRTVPRSPSLLVSQGSWGERAQLNVPLSAPGRRRLPPHPFFSLPHPSHHPPCLRSCHASVILSFSVRFKSPFKGLSRVRAVLAQKASLISCLFSFADGGGGGRRERAAGFKNFYLGCFILRGVGSLELLSELGVRRQGAPFGGEGWSGKRGLPLQVRDRCLWVGRIQP